AVHFSRAAWADAREDRSATRSRNPAAIRKLHRGLRQIREHRAVVAAESRTSAGLEPPSLGAETRARPRLWGRIFPVHPQKSRPFRFGTGHRARRPVCGTTRALRSSTSSLED